jgi:hypothetical protein
MMASAIMRNCTSGFSFSGFSGKDTAGISPNP